MSLPSTFTPPKKLVQVKKSEPILISDIKALGPSLRYKAILSRAANKIELKANEYINNKALIIIQNSHNTSLAKQWRGLRSQHTRKGNSVRIWNEGFYGR